MDVNQCGVIYADYEYNSCVNKVCCNHPVYVVRNLAKNQFEASCSRDVLMSRVYGSSSSSSAQQPNKQQLQHQHPPAPAPAYFEIFARTGGTDVSNTSTLTNRLFFDIDISKTAISDSMNCIQFVDYDAVHVNETNLDFIHKLMECFTSMLCLEDIDHENYVVYETKSDSKLSYHVLFNSLVFDNPKVAKKLIEYFRKRYLLDEENDDYLQIKETLQEFLSVNVKTKYGCNHCANKPSGLCEVHKDFLKGVIDIVPYRKNGALRLPNCAKTNGGNAKVLVYGTTDLYVVKEKKGVVIGGNGKEDFILDEKFVDSILAKDEKYVDNNNYNYNYNFKDEERGEQHGDNNDSDNNIQPAVAAAVRRTKLREVKELAPLLPILIVEGDYEDIVDNFENASDKLEIIKSLFEEYGVEEHIQHELECCVYRSDFNGLIFTKRTHSTECPLCDRFHDSDNTAMFSFFHDIKRKTVTIYFGCIRFSEDVDSSTTTKMLDVLTLHCGRTVLNEEGEVVGIVELAPRYASELNNSLPNVINCMSSHLKTKSIWDDVKMYDFDAVVEDAQDATRCMPFSEVISKTVFADDKNVHTALYVQAGMKLGKTKALMDYIYEEKFNSILMLSFRILFTTEVVDKFKTLGIESYQTIVKKHGSIDMSIYPRVIVQIDSMGKIANTESIDLMVLDESESIIQHFTAKTIAHNSFTIWNNFIKMLSKTKKVILMDAYLSPRTIDVMNVAFKEALIYRKGVNPFKSIIYTNPKRTFTGMTFSMTDEVYTWIAKLTIDVVIRRKKVVVPVSSKSIAIIIKKILDSVGDEEEFIVSANSNFHDKLSEWLSVAHAYYENFDLAEFTTENQNLIMSRIEELYEKISDSKSEKDRRRCETYRKLVDNIIRKSEEEEEGKVSSTSIYGKPVDDIETIREKRIISQIYSSDSDEKIRMRDLSDVNRYWSSYDVVIYTPCITSGISFEREHFDYVYGYFNARSCDVFSMVQMLGRVRNVGQKEAIIYLQSTFNSQRKEDIERLHLTNIFDSSSENTMKGINDNFGAILYEQEDADAFKAMLAFNSNSHSVLKIYNNIIESRTKFFLSAFMIKLLILSGGNVKYLSLNSSMSVLDDIEAYAEESKMAIMRTLAKVEDKDEDKERDEEDETGGRNDNRNNNNNFGRGGVGGIGEEVEDLFPSSSKIISSCRSLLQETRYATSAINLIELKKESYSFKNRDQQSTYNNILNLFYGGVITKRIQIIKNSTSIDLHDTISTKILSMTVSMLKMGNDKVLGTILNWISEMELPKPNIEDFTFGFHCPYAITHLRRCCSVTPFAAVDDADEDADADDTSSLLDIAKMLSSENEIFVAFERSIEIIYERFMFGLEDNDNNNNLSIGAVSFNYASDMIRADMLIPNSIVTVDSSMMCNSSVAMNEELDKNRMEFDLFFNSIGTDVLLNLKLTDSKSLQRYKEFIFNIKRLFNNFTPIVNPSYEHAYAESSIGIWRSVHQNVSTVTSAISAIVDNTSSYVDELLWFIFTKLNLVSDSCLPDEVIHQRKTYAKSEANQLYCGDENINLSNEINIDEEKYIYDDSSIVFSSYVSECDAWYALNKSKYFVNVAYNRLLQNETNKDTFKVGREWYEKIPQLDRIFKTVKSTYAKNMIRLTRSDYSPCLVDAIMYLNSDIVSDEEWLNILKPHFEGLSDTEAEIFLCATVHDYTCIRSSKITCNLLRNKLNRMSRLCFEAFQVDVNKVKLKALFRDLHRVFNALDSFTTTYMLNTVCKSYLGLGIQTKYNINHGTVSTVVVREGYIFKESILPFCVDWNYLTDRYVSDIYEFNTVDTERFDDPYRSFSFPFQSVVPSEMDIIINTYIRGMNENGEIQPPIKNALMKRLNSINKNLDYDVTFEELSDYCNAIFKQSEVRYAIDHIKQTTPSFTTVHSASNQRPHDMRNAASGTIEYIFGKAEKGDDPKNRSGCNNLRSAVYASANVIF